MNLNSRPLWIMISEILSIIPVNLVVGIFDSRPVRYRCLLNITKIIRYLRVYYFFHRTKNLIYGSISVRIVEMLCHFFFILLLSDNVYCNIQCKYGVCEDGHCEIHENIRRMTGELLGCGQEPYFYSLSWNMIGSAGKLIMFFFISNLTLALITIELIHIFKYQVFFVHKFNTILAAEVLIGKKSIRAKIKDYYTNLWHTRCGFTQTDDHLSYLPQPMQNELMIDISWSAFSHSNLFKNMPLPFLRELSMYMKQEYKIPGEVIWYRNQLKKKMIYVESGTIQLISEEDGESPIIAFTSGTCLGESSLLVSYKARSKVQCKDFCELFCFEKKDLLTLSRKYPKEIRDLSNIISARYKTVRQLKMLADKSKQNIQQKYRRLDVYTIIWLKNTLHKLMSKDKEAARKHEFQNIYLVSEANESDFNKLLFNARFLNTLAIAERLDVDKDTVFVKPSCPCILRPHCFLVNLWEVFIVLITLFQSFTIPYVAFIMAYQPTWYPYSICLTTIIFGFDLYIQLSTAIVTRGVTIDKFSIIAKAKMQTMGFWIDLLSCLPTEILMCITFSTRSAYSRGVMHLNRLTKLWRVERVFRTWEKNFNANFVVIRFVKFTWINFYVIFAYVCAIYNVKESGAYIFIAAEAGTGTSISGVEGQYFINSWVHFGMYLFGWLITLFMQSNILSALVLTNMSKYEIEQFCEDVIITLKSHAIDAILLKRVHRYLYTQWIDNRCLQLTSATSNIADLPAPLFYDMSVRTSKDILLNERFFQMLPRKCLYDIAGTCVRPFICSPEEIIQYAGDMSNTIVIIYGGTYEIKNHENKSVRIESDQIMINFLEAYLRIASVYTYVAVTYCKTFLMDLDSIETVLSKYDIVWGDYRETRKKCKDIKTNCSWLSEVEYVEHNDIVSLKKEKSVYNFGYNLPPDSYEEYDYYISFDKIYPFNFLRYFLLRSTFLPQGMLLVIWECSRCVIVVISNILYFMSPIVINPKYLPLLIFLDLTAIVDIYLRFHVAYYNSDGLLIKHPLYTAKHYFTHGFLIDLLAIVPSRLLVNSQSFWYYTFNSNRLLQLHRYLQFFHKLRQKTLVPASRLHVFVYVPLLMITFNYFGNLLITTECTYLLSNVRNANGFIGLECTNSSILITPWLHRPVTRVKAHAYGVYIATRLLMNLDVEGFGVRNVRTFRLIGCISLIGYYIKVIVLGKIFCLYSFRHTTLLNYQDAIRSLQCYLKRMRVNPALTRVIVDNYEYKWSCMKGKNISNTMAPFHNTLSIDILHKVYGNSLYNSSVFTYKMPGFYRNLIKFTKHDIIKMGGYLTTINDVTEHLHILYTGKAEVISPDGTILDTLFPGSIFGNLENIKQTRLHISVVASCHVDILSVKATTFHRILKHFSGMEEEYHILKAKYVTYIPSTKVVTVHVHKRKLVSRMGGFILNRTINPNAKIMQFWNMLTLLYTCYVGILIDLYQFGSLDYSIFVLSIQYSTDILYTIHFFVRDRIAYENEAGILITNLKMIRVNNRKNKLLYITTIVSLIPIDLIILFFFRRSVTKYHVFSLARGNRLLRLTYIFNFFGNFSNKLNINLYLANSTYIFMWTTFFFYGLGSTIAFFTCFYPNSIYGSDTTCSKIFDETPWKKLDRYLKYLYTAISWFCFSRTYKFYPQITFNLIVYSVALLGCLILNSVCIAQIFSMINQCSFKKLQYRDYANKAKAFMEREDVSIALLERVANFIELLWLHNEGVTYPQLLREAPLYLQDAISYDACSHLLINHPIFKKCHPDCLRQIIGKLRTQDHFKGNYVQFKGAIDETMYFIFKGEIKMIEENEVSHDTVIKVLKAGESFGILQGIRERYAHGYTYQARVSTTLVTLKKSCWLYLLDFFPASKERIYQNANSYSGL